MSFSNIFKQSLHILNCFDDSKFDEEIKVKKFKQKILPVNYKCYFLPTLENKTLLN